MGKRQAAKRSPGTKQKTSGPPPGWKKVTLHLPKDLAKTLHMLAIARDQTMGQVIEPTVRKAIGGSYFVDRGAELDRPPANASADGEEQGVPPDAVLKLS
jgi:hypothetical protein